MNFCGGPLWSLICFLDPAAVAVAAMTSDSVRRSALDTVEYRKLDLRGKRRIRRQPQPLVGRRGRDTTGEYAASSHLVYVFGDEDGSEEDEIRNEDVVEPRSRCRQPRAENRVDDPLVGSVEVIVKEDDTLTNIALRYSCKISDLKRLNKLINEQDFYGLKRIRIPVIRHGVIEEQLQLKDMETNSSDCGSRENWLGGEFIDSVASSPNDSQSRQAEQLLLRYDNEIQTALTMTRLDQSTNSAVIREPVNRQISKTLNWRTILIFFLMFCVIIPIIGGLYFILKHLFNTSGN